MNILNVMSGLGLVGSIKAKLLKMGIPKSEIEGVDFNNMNSLNEFAKKIVPNLLKKNPDFAQQIKESGRLQGQTKKEVDSIIDGL